MDFNIASALKLAAEGNGFILSPLLFQTEEFKLFLSKLNEAVEIKITEE